MIFLTVLEQRILIVLTTQGWPIIYFGFFAYRLLNRRKNQLTYSLSFFFIMQAITYSVVNISVLAINTFLSFPLFIIGYFIYFLSFAFLILFSLSITYAEKKLSSKIVYCLLTFYAVLSALILGIGLVINGIEYGIYTNWIPFFTLNFTIICLLYIIIFYTIPQIIIVSKILLMFKKSAIKNRIFILVVSVLMGISLPFFPIIYNFSDLDSLYRIIHPFIILPYSTLTAFLAFISIGKGIKN